ncbi:tetratricopeptide repeat protein [Ktedonobacter racemifer]|uniref:Transcriptional regulator, XRE family n=1 Tax=Ktedonobacter racemifer DSM 44963 TaxID=485913 RepID=D6TS07_KTERA|nr:tetratricopeptide repeat protein [Ktedonobacter racemifer]EFH86080.1 transcriptional regulator, XRE family [Ktedonobacter racemifer DSM 44963]
MGGRKTNQAQFNTLLKNARLEHHLSQQEVAALIGAPHAYMISRWENGASSPSSYYGERLCKLFEKSLQELGLLRPVQAHLIHPLSTTIYDPMLPSRLTSDIPLVGRDALLQRLKELLQPISPHRSTRLVLQGLPGVGKTTLAMELAAHEEIRSWYPDGILWAGLGPRGQALTVLNRWGNLLSLNEQECRSLHTLQDWTQRLHALIGGRRLLFIIDDVWDITEATYCIIGNTHSACILTTRLPEIAYTLGGEVIQVPELNEQESLQLLRHMIPTLHNTAQTEIQELAHAVGGLPLALTLIGSYLLIQTRHQQSRRTQQALSRLKQVEHRLSLTQPGIRISRLGSDALHETDVSLQAVIEMSISILEKTEREALYALALFPPKPNTFSEEAALAVAATVPEVLDRLVDVGLLEVHEHERYQLHQSIIDYAHMNSAESQARERLSQYFFQLLESPTHGHYALYLEIENIRTAFEYAYEPETYALFAHAVLNSAPLFMKHGLFPQAQELLLKASSVFTGEHEQINQARVLCHLASLSRILAHYSDVDTYAQACLTLMEKHDPQHEIVATALSCLGHSAIIRGEYVVAETYLQQGLAVSRHLPPVTSTCHILRLLAVILDYQGKLAQAEHYFQEGLEIARTLAEHEALISLLGSAGVYMTTHGRYAEAEQLLSEGFALAQQIGLRAEICHFLLDLGDLAFSQDDLAQAESRWQESLTYARQMQLQQATSVLLQNLGLLEIRRGRDDAQALAYLTEGLEIAQAKPYPDTVSGIYCAMGDIYLKQGKRDEALQAYQQARANAPAGHQINMASALFGLAQVYALHGERALAHDYGNQSYHLFMEAKAPQSAQVKCWLQHNNLPLMEAW